MNLSSKNLLKLPDYLPDMVKESFDCSANRLTNLIGSPKHVGFFMSCGQNKLTSLLGMPSFIGRNFFINDNPKLTDVSDIWGSEIKGFVFLSKIENIAILPLIKFEITGTYGVYYDSILSILNRNRGSSKQNIIDFQYELIENGFENNAKWKPD